MFKSCIILFYTLRGLISQTFQNISSVYSPQQSNLLRNSSDYLWTPLQIRVATDLDLVFVSCGFRGINIINKEGNQILYSQDIENLYVQSLESTQDGQYIFIGIQHYLIVYHLNFKNISQSNFEMQNFDLVQNITFQTEILNTSYNQQSELLAIATMKGSVFLFNTTLKYKFYQLSTFNTGSDLINHLFISNDGNWLYIASDIKGMFMINLQLQKQNINNNLEDSSYKMVVAGYGNIGLRAQQVIASKDNRYIYGFDRWYGFFYANTGEVILSQQSQYPIKLNFIAYWPFQQMETICQAIFMNKDETLLFIGVISYGILILDIRNRDQFQVFQFINLDSFIYSIETSNQEEFLYISTSERIITYVKDQPNLNEDLPNLFNTHQIKYQDFLDQAYKWRCYIDYSDSYMIGAFDSYGLYIFPFYDDPYKFDVNNYSYYDVYVDNIYFDKGNQFMVIPRYFSVQNIGIYQYSPLDKSIDQQNISFSNMQLLKNYTVNELEISEMIVFTINGKYAVQTYAVGLIIYDSADIFNMKILARWNNLDFMIGENQGACFTNDSKWIYSTIRFFGVYLLNVEDKTNPILTDYVRTNGGENVKMSQLFNFVYLVDGVKGFAIIDASQVPNLQIISRVDLPGYSLEALFLKDEQYVLITQMERGFLTLIDIRDKYFPYIINQIQYGNQYSLSLCITQKTQYLFVTTSAGLLVLPTTSSVLIHTQVNLIYLNILTGQQELKQLDKINLQSNQKGLMLNQEYIFSVGQQIQFCFALLYPIDQNMHISNIFYYQNQQVQQIPQFFQFDQFQQSLKFNVDKGLLNFDSNQPELNIILIKTVIPLNFKSFVFQPEEVNGKDSTNITQSQQIYQYLCEKNIIIDGVVRDSFDLTLPFNLESNFQTKLLDPSELPPDTYQQIMSKIIWKIQLTLMKSFYINPIKFYVQTSLFFDAQNKTQFIQSNSQNVISITLSIQSSDGKLVFNFNPSVTYSLTELQDQLTISGSLENINKVLHSKIIFVNKTQITTQNSPNITITIQDNLNYPLIKQLTIYECLFISLKQQLKVNSENNLQDQINNQFQGGIIDIDTDIAFQFKTNSFIVSDTQDFTYEFLFLQSPNQFIQIPGNFWLQPINSNQLSFKGSTTQSMLQKSYTFKIIASDGYTKAEDTFTLIVSGIPFSYVLNLLLKIFGPIIFVLGVYQHRNIFFNAFFEKSVTFQEEIAVCDEHYVQKIIILGNIQKLSQDILSKLFVKVLNSKNEDFNQFQIKNGENDVETKNQYNNFNLSNKDIFYNWKNEKILQHQSLLLMPEIDNQNSQKFTKLVENLKKQKSHKPNSILEKRYMDYKGRLLMSAVLKDLSKYKIFETMLLKKFKKDTQITDSKIYRAIRAQLARYFLSLDCRSFIVYKNIKHFCIQKNKICINDWYKEIVNIHFQQHAKENFNNQSQRKFTTFPQLEFKYGVLLQIFQIFELIPQEFKVSSNNFDEFLQLCQNHNAQINLHLIREVIFADVLGFQINETSKFKVAFGQSLHIDVQDIKQVVACKKKKISEWLRPLQKFLNIEYSLYGISKNMRLPPWLCLDQKHGVIILYGTPQLDDVDETLIRIQDNSGYVIRQFLLRVIQNPNIKNNQQNIDQIYEVADEIHYNNIQNQISQLQNLNVNNCQNLSQNSQQSIDQVYSPLMSNQLSSNDFLWTPLIVKVLTDTDLVFVSCGFRGISIVDEQGDQILHTLDLGQQNYVQFFESTSDSKYLFVVISQNLLVYNLEFKRNNSSNFEMQNFVLLQNITFQKNILGTSYNQQKELLIIAAKGGDLFVYDTSVKSMLSLISTFNTGSVMINNIFFSQDGIWLYVASDVKGLYMLQLQEKPATNQSTRKIDILAAALGDVGLRVYQGIATKDNTFIYAFDFWYGFFYSDSSQVVNSNSSQYPIQLSFTEFWPFQDMQTTCQTMVMNQEETFIFLGVRSYGILIFDIRQRNQIKVFELIKTDTLFISIQLSKKENYLYFCSSDRIFTFTQDQPNLNQDLPNLFNTHQIKYQDFLDMVYKWRCYVDYDDQYLIGGFDVTGLYVLPFNKDPYSLDVNNFKNYDIQVDTIYFEQSNKYLIIPRYFSASGIGVFQYNPLNTNTDQQNISLLNMKEIKNYEIEDYQISEMIVFSADTKFAVQTYMIGLIIYSSSDIFNLTRLSMWYNNDFMRGENQGACFTRDNNWIYSTIRLFGVYLLNVQDKTNPILTDYITTHGGENVIMSQIFDKYIYLLDGFKGFGIIDTSYVPKLKIISRVQLPGYTVDALLINQEQYILITSMGKGFLTLIDIRNKNFPYIVNSISYEKQYGYALCKPNTSEYIFITTSTGILVLPTRSQVQIHTQVSLIVQNNITGQQTLTKLQKQPLSFNQENTSQNLEYIFTIGQQIQLNFAILYPIDQNIQINNIYYYQNGENLPLPQFFTFNKFQQSCQFFVDKSLVYGDINYPNLNIILLQAVIPLNYQSFVYSSSNQTDAIVINITQSQMIYQYLQEQNILDINGFINNQYDFTQPFNLDLQFQNQLIDPTNFTDVKYQTIIQQINWITKLALMRSFYMNPIKFYVQTSLFFDNQNTNQFIQSNTQNTISLTLSINNNDGKLIFINNPSVVFQLSDLQDQLIISGNLENVNKVLHNKIIFANQTQITSQNSPNITLTIKDDINYPIIKQFTIYECQFITLKKQLQVSSDNNLQSQINKQFQGDVIDIESEIAFSFSKDTFFVSDTQDLTYQYLYLQSSSNYSTIPLDFWLQSSSGNNLLSFKGSTTSSMFQQSYTFKIIASDGYTKAEDTFVLVVSGIPLLYLLNLLLKIIGPLVFVLGLFQQRSIFLNAICKRRVSFSEEVAVCSEFYMKQLIILGNIQKYSQMILLQLFNKVSDQKKVETKSKLQKRNSEKHNNIYCQMNQQKYSIEQSQLMDQNNDLQNLIKSNSNLQQKKLMKQIQNLKKLKPHDRKSQIEKKYMDSRGNILMSQVIKDIISYDVQIKQLDKQNFQNDIQNTDSKIYRGLRAYLSRYFLNLDYKSFIVYSYIKYFCSDKIQNCENDWFKAIVKIDYQLNDQIQLSYQQYKQQKVFPKLELKYGVLLQILQQLDLLPQSLKVIPNSFEQFIEISNEQQTKINLYLIREVIFADVYGFCGEKASNFKVAYGQSLHIDSQNIKQIVACKKKKISKWLRPLYQFFNLEYTLYGISKNMRLPSWLYLDQKNGVIILHGIPVQDDIEEVLIRILDNTGYIIQQYKLKIIKNKNIEEKCKDIDQIYQVADEINYLNENNYNKDIAIQKNNNFNINSSNSKKLFEQKSTQFQNQLSQFSLTTQQSPCRMKDYSFKNKNNSKNNQSMQIYNLNEDQSSLNNLANNCSINKNDLTQSQQFFFPKFLQNVNQLEKEQTDTSENKVHNSIEFDDQDIDEIIE
ncbi:hypothetical protein ABPG74_003825 [Tetrahymena malaccensis]